MSILMVPSADEAPWPTLGPDVCAFIESQLCHGPGDLLGKPVELNDEQRGWIYRMYEIYPEKTERRKRKVVVSEPHPMAGKRRFHRAALSLRKGSSKTEFAAWIAIAELHPDGPVRCDGFTTKRGVRVPVGRSVTDPYIPMISYTEEQTEELAYGALRRIIEKSNVADDFDIGLERIMRLSGDGKAEAVSGSPNARDGARTTFQHADEALALDTPLPTPTGWTTMGAVRPGDMLISSTGKPCTVLGKSAVHRGRPCYRVAFADGTSVVADEGHLWLTRRRGGCGHGQGCRCDQRQGWAVRRTADMLDTSFASGARRAWRYHAPVGAPLDTPDIALPIEPYTLGLWLGDGDSRNATVSVGVVDRDAVQAAIHASGHRATVCASAPGRAALLYVTTEDSRLGRNGRSLCGDLRALGLLEHKHIPTAYLRAGTAQRLALLQGLMDSDGHVSKRGDCVFVNTNDNLVEGVAELARTLGMVPSIRWRQDRRQASYLPVGKVAFQADRAMPVFRLARKWNRLRSTRHPRHMARAIVAIEPVPSVPVQCLKVDAPDSLFRAGVGMVLTHNTHRFTLDTLKRGWSVMLANLAKRPLAEPWALETTTAPEPGMGSVAESTMLYAQRMDEEGTGERSKLFFFHRQAADKHDLDTESGLRAAIVDASGPFIAKWTAVDTIAEQFRAPDADRAYLERVWLNRPVQASGVAFNVDQWRSLSRPGFSPQEGAAITIGFDGSRYDDSTALIATDVASGYQWSLGVWAHDGTPTWEVPVAEVDGAVSDAFERYNVLRMYCDPPKWESWVSAWSGRYGKERVVEWWTNRRKPMAYAIRAFIAATTAGELTHSGDTTIATHIANSRRLYTNLIDEQGGRLWILRKERPDSPNKIDAAMGAILSWEARNDAIAAGLFLGDESSIYDSQALTMV